eukprot:COSAG05_NODE_6274_length_987_cov_1.203829_1_plen_224_part_10
MSLSTAHEEIDAQLPTVSEIEATAAVAALCAAAEKNGSDRYALAGIKLPVVEAATMLYYAQPHDEHRRPRCLVGENLSGLIFTENQIIRSKNYDLDDGQANTDPIDMWRKGGGDLKKQKWTVPQNGSVYTVCHGTGIMTRGGTERRYRYKFFYLHDLSPRFTLYVLGTEFDAKSTQFSPGKRSPGLERTVSRVPKKPLMAGASVCPGGVLEDEAEDINQIARTA